jgi:hypothetical protein
MNTPNNDVMKKVSQREKIVERTLSSIDVPTFKCATSSFVVTLALQAHDLKLC